MKYLVFSLLLLMLSCKQDEVVVSSSEINGTAKEVLSSFNEDEKLIKTVLMNQQNAWNEGSIDKFMEGYWKSEELTFIGRSGVNRGWQTTLDNYKKGYPDKAAMGELIFEVLELNRLADGVYRMIGTYELKREKDNPSGIFTLIWQRIDGNWVITSDQTCG